MPTNNSAILTQATPKTTAETPKTANEISNVSQIEAVKTTGRTEIHLGWIAP